MASSPPKPKRLRRSESCGQPLGELLVDEILTRLPIAAAVRFRAVCREWNAALTSDHFIRAHRARAAAARHPELLFFAPGDSGGHTTSFYACSLRDGEAPAAARELLTVADISADHAVLSPTPCRGLTLIFDAYKSDYYLFNLSTGDHVALPPCQPAAALESTPTLPTINPTSYPPASSAPWIELSTTGLGYDTATGEHKVVRLFKKRNGGEYSCEVYTQGAGEWRRCVGRVPPCAANFLSVLPPVFVHGYLYWLLQPAGPGEEPIHRILSFSIGAEQFGWVYMPPRLSSRICHLADLDGSLCAVFDNRLFGRVYGLFTWSGPSSSPSPSWSVRCSINLQSLPEQVSEELAGERVIVPLCSAGGSKILLATGGHNVFAYDGERNAVERVFRMQDLVDVPRGYLQAPLLLSVGLHDERIADVVHRRGRAGAGERRLKVKLGSRDSTVVKTKGSVR
uniref:F-box domain-containing protein n=1 Tax=Oryza punctata TaxID=4537 RepID=A0A0E0M4L7_ORYPU